MRDVSIRCTDELWGRLVKAAQGAGLRFNTTGGVLALSADAPTTTLSADAPMSDERRAELLGKIGLK